MDPTSDEPNCATLSNELIDFMSCPCLTRIFHISYPSVEMSAAREKGGEKSEGIYQTAENSKPWEKLFLKRSDKPWQQEGEMNYQFLVFVVSASKLTDKPGIYHQRRGHSKLKEIMYRSVFLTCIGLPMPRCLFSTCNDLFISPIPIRLKKGLMRTNHKLKFY